MRRLILLTLLTPLLAHSQQCSVDYLFNYTQLGGDKLDEKMYVNADTSEADFDTADFKGDVKVKYEDKHIFAPSLNYKKAGNVIKGEEGIIVATPESAIKGTGGKYDLDNEVITFEKADYLLIDPKDKNDTGANGYAKNAKFDRKKKVDEFENVTWTTCSRENPSWHLQASNLTLNHNKNRATAKNMTFRIKDTPIFWLPYFSYPMGGRATGFLLPSVGSSESRGLELALPFYWNIAPNQDATITTHPMSKRGLMMEGEYRFLTEKAKGQINAAVLPNDKKYREKTRWELGASMDYRFNQNWDFTLKYDDVSDIDYLDHMDRDFTLYDEWYLDRYAQLSGRGNWGNLGVKVQDYKRVDGDIDESATPYSKLPQITYTKGWDFNGLKLNNRLEATNFQKSTTDKATRLTGEVEASYKMAKSYGYLEPKISGNFRHYDFNFSDEKKFLNNQSKNLFIPTFSLDGSLIFEREFKLFDADYTQTLEPRLFYLYTPYKSQKYIPNFDTAESSKSWNWLFARNRFYGGDKIGDANQLTTAVSTRFFRDSDGLEKAKLSVGQIQYFSNRKVGLDSDTDVEKSKSVLVTEGKYAVDRHWSLYGISFFDTQTHRNERNIAEVRYDLDKDRYLKVGHSYNEKDYNQLTVGGGWRIGNQWRLFGRNDYSLRFNQNFNAMAGIEFEDCCWAWRLAARHYRDEPDSLKTNNALYLEFVFKGLGNMGSSSGKMLSEQLDRFQPLNKEKSL